MRPSSYFRNHPVRRSFIFFFKPEDVSALFSIKFEVKGRNLFHTSGQLIAEFIRISIRLKSIHFALNRFRCREMVSDCGSFGLSSGILPSVFYVRNYRFRILQYPEEFFFSGCGLVRLDSNHIEADSQLEGDEFRRGMEAAGF